MRKTREGQGAFAVVTDFLTSSTKILRRRDLLALRDPKEGSKERERDFVKYLEVFFLNRFKHLPEKPLRICNAGRDSEQIRAEPTHGAVGVRPQIPGPEQ